MRSWRWLTAVIAVLSVGALSACGGGSDTSSSGSEASSGAEELVIGFAGGLTGESAIGDVPARAGMEYAVEQINAAGGIDGHQVDLIVKDMKSDPKLAGVVAQELIDQGAAVLTAAPFPDQNVGTIRTGAEAGVPTVLVASTDPNNAQLGGRTAYMTAFADNQQAAAAAEYALDQGAKTAMTVSSADSSYTRNAPAWFAEVFEEGGGEVVGDVEFSIGQQDFTPVATEVAGKNPDVVYTSMFVPDTPVFLRALRGAGYDGTVLGADGFDSPELVKGAGRNAENVIFTTHGFPTPGSAMAEVMDGIAADTGQAPESVGFAGLGYDAIGLIEAAVEAAGSIEPEAIDEALAELATVEGITGEITLAGTNGVPIKDVTLVEVKDGELVLADQFVPQNIPTP